MLVIRKTVLHVEDDAGVARAVDRLLRDNGYSVSTAYSAREGLRHLKVRRPDIILLDMKMPGMSGGSFVREITGEDGKTIVPVIVFTAFTNMVDDDVRAKVCAVLAKPTEINLLPGAVAEALRDDAAETPGHGREATIP
jgi:two-component system OmpR family response regulator